MLCQKPVKQAELDKFEIGVVLAIILTVSLMFFNYESTYTATVVSDELTYSKVWTSWTYPIVISGLNGIYAMEATKPFVKGQVIKIKAAGWNIKNRLVHSPGS